MPPLTLMITNKSYFYFKHKSFFRIDQQLRHLRGEYSVSCGVFSERVANKTWNSLALPFYTNHHPALNEYKNEAFDFFTNNIFYST